MIDRVATRLSAAFNISEKPRSGSLRGDHSHAGVERYHFVAEQQHGERGDVDQLCHRTGPDSTQ